MIEDIVKKVEIAAPIEKVWAFLANAEKLEHWLMAADHDPAADGAFAFLYPPDEECEGSGRVDCRVLAMKAPNHISMTWTHAHMNWQETILTIDLAELGGGTRLTLVHSGWDKVDPGGEKLREDHNEGWSKHLNCLDELATGKSDLTWQQRKQAAAE